MDQNRLTQDLKEMKVIISWEAWRREGVPQNDLCLHSHFKSSRERNLALFRTSGIYFRVYFPYLWYRTSTQEEAYSLDKLFCDIGGALGLLLGASVMSCAELLDYILVMMSYGSLSFWKRRRRTSSASKIKAEVWRYIQPNFFLFISLFYLLIFKCFLSMACCNLTSHCEVRFGILMRIHRTKA